ncbi:hypothetical protein FFY44_26270 (plasmid) [Klebsiella pneumoniae subsp. pneumoniae]|nr:hypothetical protein FFY44_26270 [Klebsiella pneumoniae subsp. pneumoniae]
MFAGKKSAQIREILISESAWEDMTCLFALSLANLSHEINLCKKNRCSSVIPGGDNPERYPLAPQGWGITFTA